MARCDATRDICVVFRLSYYLVNSDQRGCNGACVGKSTKYWIGRAFGASQKRDTGQGPSQGEIDPHQRSADRCTEKPAGSVRVPQDWILTGRDPNTRRRKAGCDICRQSCLTSTNPLCPAVPGSARRVQSPSEDRFFRVQGSYFRVQRSHLGSA